MRRIALPFFIVLCVVVLIWWLLGTRKPQTAVTTQQTSTTFPTTFADARGKQVTVAHQPFRIISLAPSVTETLFAIGAGDRVIADTTYCEYPTEAAKLPKIGGYVDPHIEKIVSLKPDLIIGAKGNPLDALDRLEQLGIPVVTVAPESLKEVETSIRLIGRITGTAQAAESLAARCAQRRDAVTRRTQALHAAARPRTLLLFSPDSLFSAGSGSYLDEMIQFAGGVNVAARAKTPWPELSMETVVTTDPEIIVLLTGRGMAHALTPENALKRFRTDRRWREITAVKTGRVAVLDDDTLTLPGPRLINGLEDLAAAIHPDLFLVEARQ